MAQQDISLFQKKDDGTTGLIHERASAKTYSFCEKNIGNPNNNIAINKNKNSIISDKPSTLAGAPAAV